MKFLYSILQKVAGFFQRIYRKWSTFYWSFRARMKCKSYTAPLHANFQTFLTKRTELGKNVNFNGMIIVGGGGVKIGDNFHSGRGCKIITSFHNYEGTKIPYDETYIHRDVVIEDNVWLGDQVMILGGATIGEGAIIQAGSVVIKDIPKYGIAGGHPAMVFKYRDKEHYEALKTKGAFH